MKLIKIEATEERAAKIAKMTKEWDEYHEQREREERAASDPIDTPEQMAFFHEQMAKLPRARKEKT